MIRFSSLEDCKSMIETLVKLNKEGILFIICEEDTIVWRRCSDAFHLDLLSVGCKVDSNTTTMKAIREKRTLDEEIPCDVYGEKLKIESIPIINDENIAIGALSILKLVEHPVVRAIDDIAPILVEMFPEGAFIFVTDLTKITYRRRSEKFDMPTLTVDRLTKPGEPAELAIKNKKPSVMELGAEQFGVPIYIVSYPLFDEKENVVASLGICMPKQTAVTLRGMSNNLEDGLMSISSAIQQLAASATEIHTNEQSLNGNIKNIITISDEINKVSAFIKAIADQTKMLGLNASIEAARAGEVGRGFSVVADEIRKLSEQSKSAVPKINKLTEEIKIKVEEASGNSKNSLEASQEQAAATEEITSSIEEMTSMSMELSKIALTI